MSNPFELSRQRWTIWKYAIPLSQEDGLNGNDTFELLMPKGALPFSVGNQHGKPVLWVMVKQSEDEEGNTKKRFLICGTGRTLMKHPNLLKPLGTILMEGGYLVLHVFEIAS